MAVEPMTYKQLDRVLSQLGFMRKTARARNRTWLYYEHAETQTEVIVVEKKPAELVSPTATLSVRRQLIENGLVREEELDQMLSGKQKRSTSTG